MHIHLQWHGPYTKEEAKDLNDDFIDYGVYQIYGAHPVYGSDVLLYIGKASERCFGTRISEHNWTALNQDAESVKVYVGRLCSYSGTPDDDTWRLHIDMAERLLISAHQPARNSSGLNTSFGDNYFEAHILNWGQYKDLLPEVSGARYSSMYYSSESYEPYGESLRESQA